MNAKFNAAKKFKNFVNRGKNPNDIQEKSF